jgi:8-oxo-dGTP pyrophosphatase MutT (NUDIX family)
VFPKGGVKKSETAGEAALRETWEEAGVTGRLEQEFEGFFVLQVEEVADEWPEKGERQRYWFGLDEALRLGNVTEEVHRLIVKVVDYIRLHEKPGGGCIMM